jgi:hypothetical protein
VLRRQMLRYARSVPPDQCEMIVGRSPVHCIASLATKRG